MLRTITMPCKFLSLMIFSIGGIADARAADGPQLNIYSATDTAAMTKVIKAFSSDHPDIRVVYHEYNTRELYEAVENGSAKDADVVISSSTDLQVALVNEGRAQEISTVEAEELPDWAHWRHELFAFTYEPVVALYNKKAFKDRTLPKTRSELAGDIRDAPEFYKGRIGTYDIAASGVGYMFVTQDLQRDYQFWRLAESFGRAGLKTYCCTSDMVSDIASGKLVFAYNVIGTYALDQAGKDSQVGFYAFSDYNLVMSRTAYVPKEAPNRQAAIIFVSYLLSARGQQRIADLSPFLSLDEADSHSSHGRLSKFGNLDAMLPIHIGPGLLAYLDRMKRRSLLKEWREAIVSEDPEGAVMHDVRP